MSLKSKKWVKKLVLVLVTSMSGTTTREKIVETTKIFENTGAVRADEDGEGGEYLGTNLA